MLMPVRTITGGASWGAGRQDMGVAEAGIHHPALGFDGKTGQLFLIEGDDFSFAPGASVNGCGGHYQCPLFNVGWARPTINNG